MNVDDYRTHDLTGLARLIAAGEITAGELHDIARAAIEEVDTELGAVADGPWESPLAFAADGPFAGVPFVVEDLVCHPRDVPMRLGSRLTGRGLTHAHDTFLMRRFREAGLATIALTTTPELGFNAVTEALAYGPTRNPWDLSRSPGGSSGGSSALVAARAVPAAHGSDGAGSIRIPAAACGLVGLKPSRGRVSAGPDAQDIVFGLAIEFAVTRTVRDSAALLDAVSGTMPGDPVSVAPPSRPFRDEVDTDPGTLRIAVHTDSWAGSEVDTEVRTAVEQVASELERLGHRLEYATPKFDWGALLDVHVVPLASTHDDVPIGVQLSAAVGEEATLLRVAGQLEDAMPWEDRMPSVCAGT